MALIKPTKKKIDDVIHKDCEYAARNGTTQVKFHFCPLCEEEVVGTYKIKGSDYLHRLGVTAVCIEGGSICQSCYNGIKKQKVDPVVTLEEKWHNYLYNKFLQGKAYPEIKVKLVLFDKQGQRHELNKPIKSYKTFLNNLSE